MDNERSEVRPGAIRPATIQNRLAAVEILAELRKLGYTDSSAREYIKTGNIDRLKLHRGYADMDGTETR